jgi:iron complex transport system permease protein
VKQAVKSLLRAFPFRVNAALLLIAVVVNIAVGAVFIPPQTVFMILARSLPGSNIVANWPAHFETILLSVRLPHMALIMLAGAALASSGAAYQGLFRNPLADPYLIGVASGAGLGAVAAFAFGWPQSQLGYYWIPISAFAGALLTIVIVYTLAKVGQIVPLTTLILAGVAVGAFANALTSFLMITSNEQLYRSISFLLGGSPLSGWEPVLASLPYVLPGMLLLSLFGHALNLMQFGEEQALQMGLNVERTKKLILFAASLTTAVAVAFAGVIGFVGLIVPHLLRMVWGLDYRRLIPLSIIAGASALLFADTLARIVLAPRVLPLGIVTALAGAPFFLWILRRAKVEVFW